MPLAAAVNTFFFFGEKKHGLNKYQAKRGEECVQTVGCKRAGKKPTGET